MVDLLETGSNWLQSQRKTHCSRPVVYRRGADTVTVLATVGKTEFEKDDGVGAIVRSEVRDYLIDTMDLVLAGTTTLPERGDLIEETVGSEKFIYEVMPIGSESHYRFSDPYRKSLRIHTRHIATEAL